MASITRILVFGSSGCGKTSMLIELTGEKRPVGDGIVGVTTFKTSPFKPVERNDTTYVFFDTAGLNENDTGKVPGKEALKGIVKLLRDSKDGYNLLIHVIRVLPRNTDLWKKNHEFFVHAIAGNKIPVLLVFTGCEAFDPMSLWRTQNLKDLKKLGLKGLERKGIVCSCFHQAKARGGRRDLDEIYNVLRKESGEAVWASIATCALEDPFVIYTDETQFAVVMKRAVNWFARLFFPEGVFTINEAIQKLLRAMGFTETEAQHFAEKGEFPEQKKSQ